MPLYYVTGLSGTGKSAVRGELRSQGSSQRAQTILPPGVPGPSGA